MTKVSHGNFKLDTEQESPYCDNPCYFPDVETDDCAQVMSVCNETADVEDPYVEVLENNVHTFTNRTIVREIQHERLTNKLELIEKVNDTVTRGNLRMDAIPEGRCSSNGSPYSEDLLFSSRCVCRECSLCVCL